MTRPRTLAIPILFVFCLAPASCSPDGDTTSDGGPLQLPDRRAGTDVFFHVAVLEDVDGDGIQDLITVGEYWQFGVIGALTFWMRGQAQGPPFENELRLIGEGLGGFPRPYDLDGDGDRDLVAASFFHRSATGEPEGVVWYERIADPGPESPSGVWEYHVIDKDLGPGIEVEIVEDFITAGDTWLLFSNHTNENLGQKPSGLYLAAVPDNPLGDWDFQLLSDGILSINDDPGRLAPGIFDTGDIDGDGRKDILLSGDGDRRVFWFQQGDDGAFHQHELEPDSPQAGGARIVDLNNDGRAEVVMTGYDREAIHVYEGVSAAGIAAVHVVDDAADGPAFVEVVDLNSDGRLDLVASLFGTRVESNEESFHSAVIAYYQGDSLDDWQRQVLLTNADGIDFPQQSRAADIDSDGDPDLFIATGWFACAMLGRAPCGELFWLENVDGSFVRHQLIEKGQVFPKDGNSGLPDATVYGTCDYTSSVTLAPECRDYLVEKVQTVSGASYTPEKHCLEFGVYTAGPEVTKPTFIAQGGCESLDRDYVGVCDTETHRIYLDQENYTTTFAPGTTYSAEVTCGFLSGQWFPIQ